MGLWYLATRRSHERRRPPSSKYEGHRRCPRTWVSAPAASVSVLLLVLLLVLVAINGLFVAAEFALVSARRSGLVTLSEEGAGGAQTGPLELDRMDEYLSACQVGITMASIGIGFLGEPSLARLLEPIFGGLRTGWRLGSRWRSRITFVTSIHISLGEQVPKMLAITGRRSRLAPGAAAVGVPGVQRPVHGRADASPTRWCACSASTRRAQGEHTEEDVKAIIRRRRRGRARSRRGRDARRRLPPPRAAGA